MKTNVTWKVKKATDKEWRNSIDVLWGTTLILTLAFLAVAPFITIIQFTMHF
jgi:hypothetical protein